MQAQANLLERITQAYVAYRGMRLLSVLAVLLSAPLLFVLAGGFPPSAWRLFAQALLQLPALLAAHGPGVLLALFGELLLSVTLLLAWGGLLWLGWKMLTYWLYERRELRSFAADLEEAQYQAEGVEEQYEEDKEFAYGRAGIRPSSPPPARRRVVYPLAPLDPPVPDDDYSEEREENVDEFFEADEEVEEEMALYRDEDEEEDGREWSEQQAVGATTSGQSTRLAGTQVYERQSVERTASASGASGDNIQHSSYGRILPFSVASSAGALPHLTTTLYNRVPLPHSVSPNPVAPQAAPAQSGRSLPEQPISPLPTLAGRAQAAQSSSYVPVEVQPPQNIMPAPPALPLLAPPRLSTSRAVPARPTAQRTASPVPARPTAKLVPTSLGSVSQQIPDRPAMQPLAPSEKPTAMQSLVELISTVPLNPQVQSPLLSAQAGTGYPGAPAPASPSPVPAEVVVSEIPPTQAPNPPMPAEAAAFLSASAPVLLAPGQAKAPVHKPEMRDPAMQSLTELISTVPLNPQSRSPLPLARPMGKPDASLRRLAPQLVVSTGLDVGLRRRGKPNEDSLLALQNMRLLRGDSCPVGLFVVADGMGGHENGQEASHLVVQSLSKSVVPSVIYGPTDDNYAELLVEGVHRANLEVYQRNRQAKVDMGTTIVAALVIDTTAYIVSAGDSRVYLYRAASGLTQVTRDHSTVARLVENGLIKPEDIYTHPRRNEIYRSLGHHPSEDLDKFILALQPDDVLMLCSDGLWEMVRDEHIQEIIASTASQPEQTSAALVQAALDGGGKDNISVIVVHVKAAEGAQAAWAG